MSLLTRTVDTILETNCNLLVGRKEQKKVFQYVKHVTGKQKNMHTDYELSEIENSNGYQAVYLKGQKGFIRFALTPLFEII